MIYREEDFNPEESLLSTIPYETRLPKSSKFSFTDIPLIIPIIIFIILYISPILEFYPMEHTAFSIIILSIFLLVFDRNLNINSCVISYLVPILSVWLCIGFDKETGTRIPATDLSTHFTFLFMSPEILIFLGSITIIKAIEKYKLNDHFIFKLSTVIQPYPRIILFMFMLLNIVLGFFFSSIVSSTFMISLAMSVIRFVDSSESFAKALLLGISWSGNCSDIISIYYNNSLPITRFEFLIYSMPSSFVLCGIECFVLMKLFKLRKRKILIAIENKSDIQTDEKIINKKYPKHIRKSESASQIHKYSPKRIRSNELSFEQYLLLFILLVYFIIFMFFNSPQFIGHLGIISLVPIVLIFGCDLLNTNDFNTLSWSAIGVAGGGLAMNEVFKISGLFDLLLMKIFNIANHFNEVNNPINKLLFHKKGFVEWFTTVLYLFVFSLFSSVFNDKRYLIDKINELWSGSPIVMSVSFLIVNVAQLLPASTFSNNLALCVINEETQEPFLSGSTIFKYGLISELIAILIFSTIGYYLACTLEKY